ncbi:MAG: hypothetical protein FWH29_00590 [Methanobrevibacter sp.]|nr:hypothetical protein [Methanobrevibacter sp.]
MRLPNLPKKNHDFMDFKFRGLTFQIPKKYDIIPSKTTDDVFIGDPERKIYALIFFGQLYCEQTANYIISPSGLINGIEVIKTRDFPQFSDTSFAGSGYSFKVDGQYFSIFINDDCKDDVTIEKILEKI